MTKRHSLTSEQTEKLKILYAKGYSATAIFTEIDPTNPDYIYSPYFANTRMQYYIRKFGLPRRGTGFKPKVTASFILKKVNDKKEENCKRRIQKLEKIIPIWTKRIENWKTELQFLKENQ